MLRTKKIEERKKITQEQEEITGTGTKKKGKKEITPINKYSYFPVDKLPLIKKEIR